MGQNNAYVSNLALSPLEETLLIRKTRLVTSLLKIAMHKKKIAAHIFLGGSFAKKTLLRGDRYDIDIFIRAKKIDGELGKKIYNIIKQIGKKQKWKIEQVHGSRDYYRVHTSSNFIFELIPVKFIRSPRDAENSTDLSYAHVSYVKKQLNLNSRLRSEILIAKQFCKAQGVYGAESYICGLSGYAIECLIIYYKSFLRMAKEISKAKEQIFLDPEKHYKNKQEISISLNESKTKSPIILIDPTWKERNVIAALSAETFNKLKVALKKFLKNPSEQFFIVRQINEKSLKQEAVRQKAELISISIFLGTKKPAGDIAGTKLRKCFGFLCAQLKKRFLILKYEFVYGGAQKARGYCILKPMKDELRHGPPLSLKKHVLRFKSSHRKTIIKNGFIYAVIPKEKSGYSFLRKILNREKETIKQQGVAYAKAIQI